MTNKTPDVNTKEEEKVLVRSNGRRYVPRPVKFNAAKQKKFLQLLSQTNNVRECCRAIDIDPSVVYRYKDKDPKFKEEFARVQAEAYDMLEASAFNRALNGSLKGVWHQGTKVGEEINYHDNLTMFMLKNNVDKYRDRSQIELTGKNGGPVEVSDARSKLLGLMGITLEGDFEEIKE